PVPATHVLEVYWEKRATDRKPMLLPMLVTQVRELTLAEVAARSEQFATLDIAELRFLMERNKVVLPNATPGEQPKQEMTALLEALRAHLKNSPAQPIVKRTIAINKSSEQVEQEKAGTKTEEQDTRPTLPPDIAVADEPTLAKIAAMEGFHEEYGKLKIRNLP